ncbi:hypothetical protein GCM10009733_012880 [Nonomuraea maheshkhaliensis]|uniref:Uncharacterized protein n=1 Tax=Nonomuraea maheshkhaliensis TaxID=419590 RepID=A0ABP4QUU8_9ACTN
MRPESVCGNESAAPESVDGSELVAPESVAGRESATPKPAAGRESKAPEPAAGRESGWAGATGVRVPVRLGVVRAGAWRRSRDQAMRASSRSEPIWISPR